MNPAPRLLVLAAACGAAHGLARALDAGLGLALRSSLDAPGLAALGLSLVDPQGATVAAAIGATGAAVVALGLRGRGGSVPFLALLLRPLLSVLALAAVALEPAYPYAFTLPVALGQDLSAGQDALALAVALAAVAGPWRIGAPRAFDLFLASFIVYLLITPGWAWHWDNHPGNEPKTLRMALALGHFGSLDTEPVSAPMEDLPAQPVGEMAAEAAATIFGESARMLGALAEGGPAALGAGAIRATREARQTVRGKEGGIFHVLSPGPSLLLAPTLRVDRALNRALGTPGRVAVSVALFCALAAALVAALYLLVRDATGVWGRRSPVGDGAPMGPAPGSSRRWNPTARPGIAAALAACFALTPPFLFYPYQFYPEMPGALAIALLWRFVLFGRGWSGPALLGHALVLASLPWLHQKFLPVWGVLCLHAGLVAVWRLVSLRALATLVLTQVASLYFFLLWNFAITGSARPDAVFLAWGPGGVTGARVGEGLAGLAFDLRYGLLPWAPLYLLGVAALLLPRLGPLRLALPSAAVYYLTVAAADNWSGAVCMLGRYAMPATPLLVAGLGVLLARAGGRRVPVPDGARHRSHGGFAARRGLLALVLALGAWTALFAAALHRDPHAANDCALLAAKSELADTSLYVPNLFFRTPGADAPEQRWRTAGWLAALGLLALFSGRAAGGAGRLADRPLAMGGAVLATVLAAAFVAEQAAPSRRAPAWRDALEAPGNATVFTGPVIERSGRTIVVGPGERSLLVRAREPLAAFRVLIAGASALRARGHAPTPLLAAGAPVDAPVELLAEIAGRGGAREWLYRLPLDLEGGPRIEIRFDGGRSGD
ncbi:MAG: hypothetical protein NDJ94_06180 [Vicinamibacteria bacterium]|nr:hypothetical protein [Vicinamibacteria bacterium]